MGVRLVPERREPRSPFGGRRIIAGGALILPLSTVSLPDGSFELETHSMGRGVLAPLDGSTPAQSGIPVLVEAGRTRHGLRLLAARQ